MPYRVYFTFLHKASLPIYLVLTYVPLHRSTEYFGTIIGNSGAAASVACEEKTRLLVVVVLFY